jgi:hypothetical protein
VLLIDRGCPLKYREALVSLQRKGFRSLKVDGVDRSIDDLLRELGTGDGPSVRLLKGRRPAKVVAILHDETTGEQIALGDQVDE